MIVSNPFDQPISHEQVADRRQPLALSKTALEFQILMCVLFVDSTFTLWPARHPPSGFNDHLDNAALEPKRWWSED